VESAEVSKSDGQSTEVLVKLSPSGAQKLGEATARNVGRELAIVWNGWVIRAPVVRSAITGQSLAITGRFTDAEARQLLDVLNHRPQATNQPNMTTEQQRTLCISQLRQIDGAKQQWLIENRNTTDVTTTAKDLEPYIRYGLPRCPAGGSYAIGAGTQEPTCSVAGHSLPPSARVVTPPSRTADLEARLKAAGTITSFVTRDKVMAGIARDAAVAGDAKLTSRALGKMTAFTTRDKAALEAARALSKAGHRAEAIKIAGTITSFTQRDAALKELAQ
jgi:hypothetical protein